MALILFGVGEMNFDPMPSTPQLTFNTTGRSRYDRKQPDYTAIASTPDGNHLLLVDDANRRVKVMAVTSSGDVRLTSTIRLSKDLWDIAVLPDGLVAVTTFKNSYIYLLSLQGDNIEFTSRFHAHKRYDAVAAGPDNNTLLVTSGTYLDVITYDGSILKSFNVSEFKTPDYLCSASGDDVIVSDWSKNELYRVNARTGQVTETKSHPDMNAPHQAAMDKGGNLYEASKGTNRVMVMSPAGEWRTPVEGNTLPIGVAVTANDVIVSWDEYFITSEWNYRSVIKGYSMADVN
ncbi:hypothetical protein V1264_017685 [Littorina saxatilis]|uniref:Uncharacterized protein n=1 Tax=Littorina saxatilis TaxID=31220 RepID=A0AAN9GFN6_9CAEN